MRSRSPKTVEPYSSPSQLANTIVLKGFHPAWRGQPKAPDDLIEHGASTIGIRSATDNPGISVVANDNNLIWDGAVDNANDVPQWCGDVLLLVVQIHDHVVRGRADVVVNAEVPQPIVPCPVLVEVLRVGPMAVQRLEDGECISV